MLQALSGAPALAGGAVGGSVGAFLAVRVLRGYLGWVAVLVGVRGRPGSGIADPIMLALAVVLLVFGFVVAARVSITEAEPVTPPVARMEILGTIRCCWRVLRNDTHAPKNLLGAWSGPNGTVIVDYPDATHAGTMIIAADEVYAARGVIAGASVGLSRAVVRCSVRGVRVDCTRALRGLTSGNFWVYGNMGVAE